MQNGTDLRFWDQLAGGEGARGEPGLRLRTRPRPGDWAAADLAVADGLTNLAQALVNRLLTRVGELAALGHPEYGSRLHLLVGEPASESNLRLLKLFLLEALAGEQRIVPDKIKVEVSRDPVERTAAMARITVVPKDRSGPVELEFGFQFSA